jgi:hypothetical protein
MVDYDRECVLSHIIISVITLIVFSSKMILSLIIYRGWYLYSIAFALGSCIVTTDAVALITSATSYYSPNEVEGLSYFVFFAAFVVFHSIRVFRVLYATARPPVQHADKNQSSRG